MDSNSFILTDVLPGELPLIYSNFNLFSFLQKSDQWNRLELNEDNLKVIARPFFYYIKKTNGGLREIGLPHPASQLTYTKFVEFYKDELLHFFEINGSFSIRYPTAEHKQKALPISGTTSSIDLQQALRSYFNYPYPYITGFYNSEKLYNLEVQFSNLDKIDIQNCFGSVYTHAIEWAYLGSKKIAKDRLRYKINSKSKNLGNYLDMVMSSSNDGETNGILVGAEFSRIVAEILLSRIDDNVLMRLQNVGINKGIDYDVVRYIDDFFIFTNNPVVSEKILTIFQEELDKFKFKINLSKSYTESRPFLKDHNWLSEIKTLSEKIQEFLKIETPQVKKGFKKDSNYTSSNFLNTFKRIITNYDNQKHHLISYLTKVIGSELTKCVRKDYATDTNESSLFYSPEEAIIIRIEALLDLYVMCLTYSPASHNTISYCKTCLALLNFNGVFADSVYKRSLQLLNNSKYTPAELLNILVLLKFIDRDIPEDILMNVLGDDFSYLNTTVVANYLSKDSRRRKFKITKSRVNELIEEQLNHINNTFKKNQRTGRYELTVLKNIIRSSEIIVLSDFRNCPILSSTLRRSIDDLFKTMEVSYNHIKLNGNLNNDLPEVLIDFLLSGNSSFVNWHFDVSDIMKIITIRLKKSIHASYV